LKANSIQEEKQETAMSDQYETNGARRKLLHSFATGGLAFALGGATRAWPAQLVTLPFAGGERDITRSFPQKGEMLLLRTRPPLLETPFSVFDRGAFTPSDQFYVRWHLANIPTTIDGAAFRLNVRGQVRRPLVLSLTDLLSKFEPVQLAAVNQCSGNSRGFFDARVPGAQWGNGAMGNALWTGVRLRDVLESTRCERPMALHCRKIKSMLSRST
jgi:DMSO/TMAO reductase YedYZ molybdopterin-dependent catalytic subunit